MTTAWVDLRSDTVTRPTPEMRRAMAEAEVGDDLYGEDPTVTALETEYAARVGKDAAIYVPSGTMANQLALRLLTRPGDLVVAGARQHVVIFEEGASAKNAGVQFHTVDDADGTIAPDGLRWALAARADYQPEVRLVCVENTHMPANGAPWPMAALEEVTSVARDAGVPVHMDGARLFNAEVATGIGADVYAATATTVMSCLSKGLCAPVGSVLAGPSDVMASARLERTRLGGGMRQAGVIAAAGLVALRTMIERLAEDHRRAARLALAVAERWSGSGCDPALIRTNIVTWHHPDPAAVLAHLRAEGVLAGPIGPGVLRMVTHHDVDDAGVERACKAVSTAP
jgi:threonine aldolase